MKNLAHSASRHAGENSAPSKPGIKQLAIPHRITQSCVEPKLRTS
jgi:hypothetical protein